MTSQILNTATRNILLAAGIPEISGLPVVIESDKEPAERPYLLVRSVIPDGGHPKVRRATLYLDLLSRADEEEADEAAAIHKAAADWLTENPASLYHTLVEVDLSLRAFNPGDYSDEATTARGRARSQAWSLAVFLP